MYRVPVRNLGDLGRIVPRLLFSTLFMFKDVKSMTGVRLFLKHLSCCVVTSTPVIDFTFRVSVSLGLVPNRAGLPAQEIALTIRRLTLSPKSALFLYLYL
jgi:hypothetical protein